LIEWQKAVPAELAHLVRPETKSKYFPHNPLRQYLIRRFMSQVLFMVQESGAREILDVGSGEGLVDYFLVSSDPPLSIWGGDTNTIVLQIACRMNPAGEYLGLDARNLPFNNESFDLVIMNELLEHLGDYESAIEEAARVTNRFALFSVPEWPFYQASNFLILKNIKNLGEHPDHVLRFKAHSLNKTLNKYFSGRVVIKRSFPWIIAMAQKKP
jgi:ubiquinone/menaquinone biosynthesis C-methylase UbiE